MRSAQDCAQLVATDIQVATYWASPPQAFVLPFHRSMTDQYLILWLYLHEDKISLKNLWDATRMAVARLYETGHLDGLEGVEIVPSIVDPVAGTNRILRMCVLSGAISEFLLLSASDVLASTPIRGVTCGWYWDPHDVSET